MLTKKKCDHRALAVADGSGDLACAPSDFIFPSLVSTCLCNVIYTYN